MNMKSICKFVVAALVTALGDISAEEVNEGFVECDTGEKSWHFRIGPVMAPRVRVKMHGPRYVRPVLPASSTSVSGTGSNVPADPSEGYTGRDYVDGYVGPDEGTDDPGSMISGLTWDWGADDLGSQYSDGRVEFRTEMAKWTDRFQTSEYANGSDSESDRDVLLGVEAMGGWTFYNGESFDAALDGGFRFYGSGDLSARSEYGATLTTTHNEYRYVDSYDASGWTDIPSGKHTGSAGGPGRLIGATPTREEELMGSTVSSETYYQQAETKLDYKIWDMRLGPTMAWYVTDDFMVRGGVYGLIGLVDSNLRTSVNTESGSYGAKKSKCDVLFGVAASISLQYNLTDNLFLMSAAEYDWWSDKTSLSAGGADAQIELSDFSVSLSLGITF